MVGVSLSLMPSRPPGVLFAVAEWPRSPVFANVGNDRKRFMLQASGGNQRKQVYHCEKTLDSCKILHVSNIMC